jgi:hypothetical protein
VWSDLLLAIASPGQNLAPFRLAFGGSQFPVKAVTGMERLPAGRLLGGPLQQGRGLAMSWPRLSAPGAIRHDVAHQFIHV